MKIFTSIYLNHINGNDYIRQCISSWKALSEEIYSFNIEEEYVDIEGVEVVRVDRDTDSNYKDSGKPLLYISNLMKKIREINTNNDVCVFLNSDLILEESKVESLRRFIDKIKVETFICGIHRWDLKAEEEDSFFMDGIDCFIFKNCFCDIVPEKEFVIGRQWWDWWLLELAIRNKYIYYHITDKIFLHKEHPYQHSLEDWIFYGEVFNEKINRENIFKYAMGYDKRLFRSKRSINIKNINERDSQYS